MSRLTQGRCVYLTREEDGVTPVREPVNTELQSGILPN